MVASVTKIGFIGLGKMGQPMALNLARAGHSLLVWNRSPERAQKLQAAGADVALSAGEVLRGADLSILMLLDIAAINQVLDRGTAAFAKLVADRTLVNMSSISPEDSKSLAKDVKEAGGRYVEAPVSGSQRPAAEAQLVAMVAGEAEVVERVVPLLRPMCREVVTCGPIGAALMMKLAVNLFMIVMVTGLAEATHFAERQGLDLRLLEAVLNSGPMASNVSKGKLAKLAERDFSAQAAIPDVLSSTCLISGAARQSGLASPLIDVCRTLYGETVTLGHRDSDMVAVVAAIEARTHQQKR
jgi:3-hydroxyisobutyrate dehydrogenase